MASIDFIQDMLGISSVADKTLIIAIAEREKEAIVTLEKM